MRPFKVSASHSVNLLTLPSEIISKVLALLQPHDWAQVAQTCIALRTECDIAMKTLTFLDLKNGGFVMNDWYFATLTKRMGSRLRRLELDCWHLMDSSLENLPESIEELVLCGCDHHSNQILFNVSCRLKGKLRIFAWSGFGGSISAKGFEDVALNNRCLTSFMIDCGSTVDVNQAVRTVAKNCPLLKELSACNLTMETLVFMFECGISLQRFRHKQRQIDSFHITDTTLTLIADNCPLLKELNLVEKTIAESAVTDSGILHLAERASALRILKLKPIQCSIASEVAIMQLVNFCGNLSHVELSNFKHLSDPPVYELVQKCVNLMELSLDYSQISDTSLELISIHCKGLRSISLKCCRKLTDLGIKALHQCGSLESANLGQASGLTDGSLTAICTGNPHLKVLVAGYGQVSDKGLRAVASCMHLRELALNNCSHVTNRGIKQIAGGCPMLRFIALSYCEHITDSAVISLAKGCPRLLKVRLDGCRLLSNPSVRILSSTNKKLRYLSMQHCTKLTDDVFQYLLMALSLRFVDLGRGKLTVAGFEAYHMQRPLVEICIDGRPYP
ncbi:hypothetical protein KP509_31G014500 [Ceratopteris richardii]|uniref:F-box domain-containing protein n=1 Tax=Ceratopteris richardii TaxID=49495 RepID=A0A8T2QVT3_CERRI|nr:hypothetical protein KP509_31G014500 [Ceratopteris richardii]